MRKENKQSRDIPPYIVSLPVLVVEIVRHLLVRVVPSQRYLLVHRSDPKKGVSENTLNSALRRLGYAGLLTGHGIRATISTALNEVGYLKKWVDAQLSHADPDQVSAAYNHAEYVEPRRRMMQDWADRLDLWEQGLIEAANAHLPVHLQGVPGSSGGDVESALPSVTSSALSTAMPEGVGLMVPASMCRLPAIPVSPPVELSRELVLSDLQR